MTARADTGALRMTLAMNCIYHYQGVLKTTRKEFTDQQC